MTLVEFADLQCPFCKQYATDVLPTVVRDYVRTGKVRLVRDGQTVWTGRIDALKRFKDDAREVQTGFECGISLDGMNDLKVGDVIESFTIEELARTLG